MTESDLEAKDAGITLPHMENTNPLLSPMPCSGDGEGQTMTQLAGVSGGTPD